MAKRHGSRSHKPARKYSRQLAIKSKSDLCLRSWEDQFLLCHLQGSVRSKGLDIANRDGSSTLESFAGRGLNHGQQDNLLVGTKVSQVRVLASGIFPAVTATLLVYVRMGVLG